MLVYVEDKFSPLLNLAKAHALPFAFDRRWKLTSNPNEADIVPLLPHYGQEPQSRQYEYFRKIFSEDKRVVVLALFHDADGELDRWRGYKEQYKNCIVASTSYNEHTPQSIFYDFLWNRTKAYYNKGYANINLLSSSVWLKDLSLDVFKLDYYKDIKYNILCPNRAYYNTHDTVNRLKYRAELHSLIKKENYKNVLMSDPDNGIVLQTDNWQKRYQRTIMASGCYAPIATKYYNESFLSAYVESVVLSDEGNKVKTITEKTWEPILKGHFILPFATVGFIDELKRRGFRFPEFINYDYANIKDDNLRWEYFVREFKKIQRLTITQLNTLYKDNIEIIEHNQQLFDTLPYDSLYDKLL